MISGYCTRTTSLSGLGGNIKQKIAIVASGRVAAMVSGLIMRITCYSRASGQGVLDRTIQYVVRDAETRNVHFSRSGPSSE